MCTRVGYVGACPTFSRRNTPFPAALGAPSLFLRFPETRGAEAGASAAMVARLSRRVWTAPRFSFFSFFVSRPFRFHALSMRWNGRDVKSRGTGKRHFRGAKTRAYVKDPVASQHTAATLTRSCSGSHHPRPSRTATGSEHSPAAASLAGAYSPGAG